MKETKQERGVLYIAAGRRFIRAAIRSAGFVRKHSPDLPIHLFANWRDWGYDFEHDPAPFTSVGEIESPHYRSKVDYSIRTPFERTLYLDADTRVLSDIRPVFDLLDRFDLALAHAPNRVTRLTTWRTTLPHAFPQFNAGVFLYKSSPAVMALLREWVESFHTAGFRSDQITLRELLWLSDLRIATLPPEYNLRYNKYRWLWGRREARPVILHLPQYVRGPLWFLYPWITMVRERFGGFDHQRFDPPVPK
jgi:hypothetical protein